MQNIKIAVIGLGYVGLPLAVEFAQKFPTLGFDISQTRVEQLNQGFDSTLEVDNDYLASVISETGFRVTTSIEDIANCNIYIVTVPTPIDRHKQPNLVPLIQASEAVGKILKKDDIVIYESTVYPGTTEEECVPVLEKIIKDQLKLSVWSETKNSNQPNFIFNFIFLIYQNMTYYNSYKEVE